MSKYWNSLVRSLTPYVPGEQPRIPDLVKLNTNENPYGPSPRALAAMQAQIGADLRLYPDPESSRLKQAIAGAYGLEPGEVFVGNGSDEVLAHVFLGLLKQTRPLLFPDITYSFYPVYCRLYGIDYNTVALDEAYRIRVDDYAQDCGGVIIANPNAPTGRLLPLADIERLLEAHADAVVVVDEAYVDFGGPPVPTAVPLIARHPNLLVVHTLSKSRALAGLRVGYAMGQAALVEALERVKNSFNSYPLGRVASAGAVAAIEDKDYFEACCRRIVASREALVQAMTVLGFEVLPSQANFIFARHPAHAGADLAAALRARKVLVRHFQAPRIDQFLRITVGSDEQCAALLAALREIV